MAMLGTFSFCLLLIVSPGLSFPEPDVPNVGPEVLDALLQDKQYELFSKLMKIPNVKLVIPNEAERSEDPRFNKELEFGDILLTPEHQEQARQGIRFEKYGGSKWQRGVVPYAISGDFSSGERDTLIKALNAWNQKVNCIKYRARNGEKDYVMFFKGDGCYSYMGRTGGQQPISLGNGCVYDYIIHHEMFHACGIAHEQNRWDRDEFVDILWDNIPERWRDQYRMTNKDDYGLQGKYDYYSIMHYRMAAPETGKDAFRIKKSGIDRRRIGGHEGLQSSDLETIHTLYC